MGRSSRLAFWGTGALALAISAAACGGDDSSAKGGGDSDAGGSGTAGADAGSMGGTAGEAGAAGAPGGQAGSGAAGGSGGVPPFEFDYDTPYQAAWMAIIQPSARRGTATLDATVDLAGIAGETDIATAMSWQTDSGASGSIPVAEEWSAAAIPLELGDNLITVTVTEQDGDSSSDSITVTRNPAVSFSAPFRIEPTDAFAGESPMVTFEVGIVDDPTLDPSSVKVVQVDASGSVVADVAPLTGSAGVYTGTATLSEANPADLTLRVTATASGQAALSEAEVFRFVRRPTTSEVDRAAALPELAQANYDSELAATGDANEANRRTVQWLLGQPDIASAGTIQHGFYIHWELDSGIRGGISVAPPGILANARIGAATASILEPDHMGFVKDNSELLTPLQTTFGAQNCPRFQVDGKPDPTVADFKNLGTDGITVIHGHGGMSDAGYPIIDTADRSNDPFALNASLIDIVLGRVELWYYLVLTPKFFERYYHGAPRSIVHLSACNSAVGGHFLSAFHSGGAYDVSGYSTLVVSGYAQDIGNHMMLEVMDGFGVDAARQSAFGTYGAIDPNCVSGPGSVMFCPRARLISSTFDKGLTATAECPGTMMLEENYDDGDTARTVTFSSTEKIAHQPSIGFYLVTERQGSCDYDATQASTGQTITGMGTNNETYPDPLTRNTRFLENTLLPTFGPTVNWDPTWDNPDWVTYTGATFTNDGCNILYIALGANIDPAHITETGIKGIRTGTIAGGSVKADYDYQFITSFP